VNRRRVLLAAGASLLAPGAYAQPVPIGGPTGLQKFKPGPQWAGVPGNPPSLDMNLLTATLDASITWTRANNTATDGLYTDAAGSGFNTFLANAPRINTTTGLLVENAGTNFLLNSGVAVTQTTGSLATGTYTLWTIGTGTATSSAGTGTATGLGVASAGVPNVFTVTVAGTFIVTVAGSLTRFQLEKSAYPTSYIPTTAGAATRAVDSGTLPTGAWFNAVEGTLVVDFMQRQINTTVDLPNLQTDVSNTLVSRIANAGITMFSFVANVNSGQFNATGSISANIKQKLGMTYVAATKVISVSLNGGPVVFSTLTAIPTFTLIKFGVVRSAAQDGVDQRIRYYPRALQVPELRAVTAL
jgi:hypothetical protein